MTTDYKPLSAEELDQLLYNGFYDPAILTHSEAERLVAMARRSLEIPSLQVTAYSKGLKEARASLAPKGWPSPRDVQREMREYKQAPEVDRPSWELGFDTCYDWLTTHHAAPQAEADRSDEERAREIVGECQCDPMYLRRQLDDPNCAWCQHGQDIAQALATARREAKAPLLEDLKFYADKNSWIVSYELGEPGDKVSFCPKKLSRAEQDGGKRAREALRRARGEK